MANVTYDDRSFMVDGERIWLVSGSLHYFRIPCELWRDRMLKAKRAGLNCISTCVPWNFHEPREGEWKLTGDHDVAEFVKLAEELNLYVILRPGPYIGAEWDFGGIPGWLTAKSGISYRTNNAIYTHYFDKFFRQVLPRLAEFQVTRGGSIILIQNESEYFMTTMPDRLNYLSFINQLFRRSGFDIPIIDCNGFSDPPTPDSVECVNTWSEGVEQLKQIRLRRPDAPLMVTEFRTGHPDRWGGKHSDYDDYEVARRAMEILGCGGQFNYYMWCGGTNFGFWGTRLPEDCDSYQTTSYDYGAQVAEGGALTRRYYLTKLVNMLGNYMGRYLAGCAMEEPGVSTHDSTSILNIYGASGRWAVITNNGRHDITTAEVSLPEGRHITVPLEPLGAAGIPVDLKVTATHTLDYSNLTPLGMFADRILVFHGPANFEATISVNGKELRELVPKGNDPGITEHQGLLVVLVNSDLGQRTWLVEDHLVFGPSYVGDTLEDVVPNPGDKQYVILSMDGKVSRRKIKHTVEKKPRAPKLGRWTRIRVCTEPVAKDLSWNKIDRPTDLDRLGIHYGYAWYQVQINSERPKKRYLMLPDCEDRATIYLNGERIGVWGRSEGASRSPMGANFKKGQNVLTLLVDNLGRIGSGWRLGELKGVRGHIFDAKRLRTNQFKFKQIEAFSRRVVPRQLSHMLGILENLPVFSAEVDASLTKITPLLLSFADLPVHVAVLCNERIAGFFPNDGMNFGDVTLGPELKKGKNTIKLLLWGDATVKMLEKVTFHTLNENLTQSARWAYRTWSPPTGEGLIVGKDRPAWYVAKFKQTSQDIPLFLNILNSKKGQIFLNGRNLGRFWNIGPQQRYYIPECYLEEQNELMIFEEQGLIPSGSRLEIRPLGPYRD